jgi:hypothetical protein
VLCARSIAAHQSRNDRRDDLGIVGSIGHKPIEQQNHLDANSVRAG